MTSIAHDAAATTRAAPCLTGVRWLAWTLAIMATGSLVTWLATARTAPASICDLPPRDCDEDCDELVELAPTRGPGYEDIQLPGERMHATSTSYLRRGLAMLVRYAAARVACIAATWPGNGGAIAFGDMSERTGATPGTATGYPRHPHGTHVGGRDIDIAYYQTGTPDNHLRPVCAHTVAHQDQRRCVAPPTKLDARRTALFIGTLFESPRVRVVGVDGAVAPLLFEQLRTLCRDGVVEPGACATIRLGFETEDKGRGWYAGHENHMHVSWR